MTNLDRNPSNFHRPKLPTLSGARSLALIDFLISGQETNVRLAARLMIELGSELERARWSFRNYPLRLGIRQLITSIVSVFLTMQLSILIALPSFPPSMPASLPAASPRRGRRINLFSPAANSGQAEDRLAVS